MPQPEFTVTDGIVEYKHSRPLGEYDNKTPMVRLSFTVAEGSDPAQVTAKVMGIAMEIVERTNHTNVVFQDTPPAEPVPMIPDPAAVIVAEQKKARKARPTTSPLPPAPAEGSGADVASTTSAALDMTDPTEGAAPSSDAAPSGPSPNPASVTDNDPLGLGIKDDADLGIEPLTMKGDVQPLAQRVSAHLRQKDGNIDKLRKEITSAGGNNLLSIPEKNWPEFMESIRKLLAD